ncbi:FAD/NAD(P)-binding domain-containing protein [Dentipellis sp. KUC8613]|nr:FAD/NAD(P)-binding domain-containing protein [Dentipellis sp. KUC8613]
MAAYLKKASLPTLDRLQASVAPDVDVAKVAQGWFTSFAQHTQAGDPSGLLGLFVDDAWWRDILSLTWDFRTFYTKPEIRAFLTARLAQAQVSNLALDASSASLQRPYPDIAWIQASFTFETAVGTASGIVRLVPTSTGEWKAHNIFTNLEGLKDFPELVGPNREQQPNHGKWYDKRKRELECLDEDPKVVVIGAGQSGLETAARLKYLGIKTLVIEREPRIGNLWRKRYEALCLHDTVWYDHMPYLPFPPTWPVYAPAPKLADWLESYAHSLELDVWLSTTVVSTSQDPTTHKWSITLRREDGSERKIVVNHLVFALGIGGGLLKMPTVPGADEFQGKIIHSGNFTSGRDYVGKKVVVVGACTSGHDVSRDLYENGVDVTMFQRSSTYIMSVKHVGTHLLHTHAAIYREGFPTDTADRLNASFPNFLNHLVQQRVVQDIATKDKEVLDGLKRVGFRLNYGVDGSGFALLAWGRGGGYYFDVGASQLIIDGKIKLKNDAQISKFTKEGLLFDDGSKLDADVVIFATGYGDPKDAVRPIVGEEVTNKLKPIWGLDRDGEIQVAWRDSGVPNLYFMMGNLALCRFHSKHLALQIKAKEEGIYGERYSL